MIALALTFAAEIISLVLLFPSYIIAYTRMNILNSQSVNMKVQNLTTESADLAKIVQQTNSYLNVLTSSSTPAGVVTAIKSISDVRGSAVRLGNFFYRANNGQLQIVVSGTANSRQSLLDFAKNLKNQPGVVSADLPVSDFAQAQNIDFSINILMNPQRT